jgi:seryl-tRNA synthetase
MQMPPPPPPEPPQLPEPPAGSEPTIVIAPGAQAGGGVAAAQSLAALRAKRSELSSQLSSVEERRNELSRRLGRAESAADRAGIEERIQLLDQRILGIEREIAQIGTQIASTAGARAGAAGTTIQIHRPAWGPRGLAAGQITAISIVFTLGVLMPLAIAFARRMLRRDVAPRRDPAIERAKDERMARMEQAIDAIAIEVERVSEGQRFVTQLLAEQRGLAGASANGRAAEPLRVGAPSGNDLHG